MSDGLTDSIENNYERAKPVSDALPSVTQQEQILEEAISLRGEDEIVGCYLLELMSYFGDVDDTRNTKDVEFQEDLLRRLFRTAIEDFQTNKGGK